MKNVRANARFWIAGVAAAFVGVVLARVIAPGVPPGGTRVAATVGGQLLAFAGLALICVGVSRRIRQAGPPSDPGPET